MRYGLLNRIHHERGSSMRDHYAALANSSSNEISGPKLRVDAIEIDAVLKKFSVEKPMPCCARARNTAPPSAGHTFRTFLQN
jgi:hypothetical protein